MSGSVNKVILVGNLGADPEIRRTQDGRPIVNMNIATSENWRDRSSGERRERTEWHRVVVFNEGLAKVCEQYLKKGMKVYIEGQLQTRSWEDKDGQKRYTTEVVLQGFNSSLTMLDRAGGDEFSGNGEEFGGGRGGGRSSGGGFDRGGSSGGGRSGGGGGGGSSRPAPAAGGFGDMDDEIPF